MKRVHLLFLVLLGCMDSPEKEQPDIDIVGKWRLVKTEAMIHYDHSVNQIFYKFHPNGILTVESSVGEMHGVYKSGDYTYELLNGEFGSWREYTFYAHLKFDDKVYGCYLAPDKMMLVDNPALDGPLIYFIRR